VVNLKGGEKVNKILKFEVDNMEILEEVNDSQFAKVKLYAFASGDNLHKLPVSEESLKRNAFSIYDKPLVWYYDKWTDDAGGHHELEIPCGFVHRQNNPIEYTRLDDGRLMLTINAMIWKKYSGSILSLFKKSDSKKPVSVEMQVLSTRETEDGKEELVDFCYTAITILGSKVRPAIPMAQAEITQFSIDKNLYYQQFEENSNIIIDNSKESATNGVWSNPGSKLYKPILKEGNKTELVNEAYLVNESGYEDSPSTKLKYPHHVVKDNKLILHIRGVQSAFERSKQQGLSGEPIEHIKRHYNELGLSKENFAIFGLTYDEYMNYFYEEELVKEDDKMEFAKTPEMFAKLVEYCKGIKYSKEDKEMCKYSVVDYSDTYVYCYDFEDKKMTAIPYEYAEDTIKANVDGKKKAKAKINYEAVEDEDETEDDFAVMMSLFESVFATDANLEPAANVARSKEETEGDTEVVEKDKDVVEEDKNKDKEDFEAKIQEIQSEMDNKVKEFEVKIAEFEQENKELKEFKSNILEQEKNTKIEFTANEVLESGMPKEKVDEWKEKVVEFSSVDAWANAVKADAFNYVKKTGVKNETFTRMGLPYSIDNGKDKKSSLWDD
jgi:hypothetical protein